jgi:hypothetical protein
MVYDATCRGRAWLPGLTDAWRTGGALYGALGRLDAWRGVTNWSEALGWLAAREPSRPIAEVQYWGHGTWGRVMVASEPLDMDALEPAHPLNAGLIALRARLAPDALVWFRTCETFGTEKGHAFARAWTRFFDRRAAGHTYVIGAVQSGLHSLQPGAEPSWRADEGVPADVAQPASAMPSRWGAPNTITCLHGAVPDAF